MNTYVVILNNSNLVKVGRSKDLKSRIRQIKTANPFVSEILYTEGDYENYIHRCLSHTSIIGEWFDVGNCNKEELFECLMNIREESSNDCEAVFKFKDLL
jgi:hypothetical protein